MSDSNQSEPSGPSELSPAAQGALPLEIDVQSAADLLQGKHPPILLDVRELKELQICSLGDGLHVPTGEIPVKWNSLPQDQHLLVYCHHGMRSLRVVRFLQEKGFRKAQSIQGGTDAWSLQIDPTVARY